jgi:hypothetical protein
MVNWCRRRDPSAAPYRADTSEIDIPDERVRAAVDLFGEIIVPDGTGQKILFFPDKRS